MTTLAEDMAKAANQGKPGYDVLGNPIPGYTPVSRYTDSSGAPGSAIDTTASAVFGKGGAFDSTVKPATPEEEQAIRDKARQEVQAQIDAINESMNNELAKAAITGRNNIGKGRAASAATGTIGSPIGDTTETNIEADNAAREKAIRDEANLKVTTILSGVNTRAQDLINQQKLSAQTNSEKYLSYLADTATKAKSDMKDLATAGADLTPQQKQQLIDQTGYDPNTFDQLFQSLKIANSPNGVYLNKDKPEIIGNKAVYFKQNVDPKTGAKTISTETVDLPIDPNADPKNIEIVNRDDGIYVLNKNDGTYKKVGQPSAAMVKAKADAAGGAGTDQLYNGLSAHTSTAVRARVNKYATDNTIQNFSTVQDGYNFATSLDTKTKNPADDQALIYSLAKALDPGSVVREGEYATAQKYAQSWIAAYGKGVSQAILGTGFLSETARANIKKTIEEKFKSQQRSYDQTRKSYIEGINALTGRTDGEKFIVDYVTPPVGGSGGNVTKSGQPFDVEGAKAAGYTDAEIQDYLDNN